VNEAEPGNAHEGTLFQWVVTESLAKSSVQQLLASGIDISADVPRSGQPNHFSDTEDAGFEPLTVIAGTAGIVYLARAVSRIVRDHRQGGIVIDARKDCLEIREGVRGVDSGTIVVLSQDGPKVFNAHDESGLLKALASR
jgi:hypothetical protein